MADDGLHIGVRYLLILHHEQAGEQADGQGHIHERPGKGDDQPLPARFAEQAARIAGVFIAELLARHFDVAAEQNQGEPVIRVATAKAEEARAEPKTKGFYLDIEIAGCPKMTQFVDHDHDPDQDQQPQYVFTDKQHMDSSGHGACRAGGYQLAREGSRFPVNFQDIANRPQRTNRHLRQRLRYYLVYRQKTDFPQ